MLSISRIHIRNVNHIIWLSETIYVIFHIIYRVTKSTKETLKVMKIHTYTFVHADIDDRVPQD